MRKYQYDVQKGKEMKGTTEILKALGDENRFRIFMLLSSRNMCACEMLELLDIAGSTLSAHLKILRTAGLIEQKRDGRWIEYYIDTEDLRVVKLHDFLLDTMIADRSQIDADRQRTQNLSREVCSMKVSF
jgi:ArsR family transcriptional regulator